MIIKVSSISAPMNMHSGKVPNQQKVEKKTDKDKSFSEIMKSYLK